MRSISEIIANLSPNIKASIIIIVFLIIFSIIVGIIAKHKDPTKPPKGFWLLIEWMVDWINGMCKENLGKDWKRYAPMMLTLAMFILLANFSGLIGLSNPTANATITIALGFISAFMIQSAAIRTNGLKNYIKSYFSPSPVMFPINLVSEIVTPFSLGMRLFGNILSGGVILSLIYNALAIIRIAGVPIGTILSVFVAPVFHAIFDIFLGAIQVYVFVLLTIIFISGKMPEEE